MGTAKPLSFVALREAGGLCQQENSELFFPGKGQSTDAAIAICRRCPVNEPCLEAALGVPKARDSGIFGGTTKKQRAARTARRLEESEQARPGSTRPREGGNMNRKLSGAVAALFAALVGALLLASPAQAGGGRLTVEFVDGCAGVMITIDSRSHTDRLVKVSSGTLRPEAQWVPERGAWEIEWPAEHSVGIEVKVKGHHGWKLIGEHDWTVPDDCAEPTPTPTPTVEPSPPPEPTVTPTTTPTATLTPQPTVGPIPGTAGGDELPLTGSPALSLGALGAAMLASGGVLTYLFRRRRPAGE